MPHSHKSFQLTEVIYYIIGSGMAKLTLTAIAISNATGGASGIAPHKDVIVHVTDDQGFSRSQRKVIQRLNHGLSIGLGLVDVITA